MEEVRHTVQNVASRAAAKSAIYDCLVYLVACSNIRFERILVAFSFVVILLVTKSGGRGSDRQTDTQTDTPILITN